jgi:hypothetical protein
MGMLCRSGIEILSRFRKTRSPNTDFDAQFLVDFGTGNNRGLRKTHAMDSDTGMRHHQPIHTLLQQAKTSMGKTEYRVHTLQGFACFIHVSSLRRNALATFLSNVIF